MPWLGNTKALVQTYFGGQEVGSALANVLLGGLPQGRLPITYPRSTARCPWPARSPGSRTWTSTTTRASSSATAYAQLGCTPPFAFGHGLTYTRFAYKKLRLETDSAGRVQATFTVTNTGKRAGTDVPQVYVGSLPTSVATPPRTLGGWDRVTLKPGQSRTVSVTVDRRQFSYWNEVDGSWTTPAGRLDVYIGPSADQATLHGHLTVD